MSSSQVAENYQLKWHSHLTNLNSAVATLYRNDKFADVLLFTSHSDGGCGIPAHKIILSSCSHFFASIFEVNPTPPNSMVYIVLPPELSKRSIQILIQYMYSGEATVSNDILNEVLRGGEVLKIRGLWRNNQTTEPNASSTPQYMPTKLDSTCTKDGPVYGEKTVFEHRTDRLSNPANLSTNKESPIIVMSPTQTSCEKVLSSSQQLQQSQQQQQQHQQQQHQQLQQQQPQQPQQQHLQSPLSLLPLRTNLVPLPDQLEYQLDAEVTHHVNAKKPLPLPERQLKTVNENGSEAVPGHNNQVQYQHSDRRYSEERLQLKDFIDASARFQPQPRHNELMRISERRRMSVAEPPLRSSHHFDLIEKPPRYTAKIMEKKSSEHRLPEPLNFLAIKQEPVEWTDFEQENGIEKPHIEVSVKPEYVYGEESNGEEEQQELVYSPLTCELCSETFTVPADWVRHIESHAEASHCVPKKRKRIEHETLSDNIAALRCDLCSMYFVTPAEWVRHVQNTHTETELALSNNSAPPKRPIHRSPRPPEDLSTNSSVAGSSVNSGSPIEKSCVICKKTFPSYASMVIHKRTHTGERPFYCSLCNKGFNVKSNLLRHMRTLHNQLLNSTNMADSTTKMANSETNS